MDVGGPSFIVAIVMVCTGGWLLNNWIRVKHGYPLDGAWGQALAGLSSNKADRGKA